MKIAILYLMLLGCLTLEAHAEKFYEPSEYTKKIYFHHIPKTAGISSIVHLTECLGRTPDFVDLNPAQVRWHFPTRAHDQHTESVYDLRFINGDKTKICWSHIPYYYLDKYRSELCLFTILRNPLERHLSHKRFFKLQILSRYEEISHAETCLLQSSSTANLQTFYLTSLNPFDPFVPMHEHLKSAKYNLQYNISFFGLTEHLQFTLDEFIKRVGQGTLRPVGHHNATSNRPELYEALDITQLKKDNWADFELYEFAKQLFNQRFAK